MLEKTIEKKLATAVKKAGGIAPKFVSPSFAGMPDRLILLPDGKFAISTNFKNKNDEEQLQTFINLNRIMDG